MNIEQKETGFLINEWQLGQQLNHAVHNGTRDKFNLLLSLLSDDARDFSQFSLPDTNRIDGNDEGIDLRDYFSLSQTQPLVDKGMSTTQAQTLNANLQKSNLCSIRLQLLLNNEAVLSRAVEQVIPSDIVDNLPFLAQQRLEDSLQSLKSSDDEISHKAGGIDHKLMAQYQALDLENKPVKLNYM